MQIVEENWRNRQARQQARLQPFVERYRERRSRGEKHPVEDFLWQYFSIRPGRLLQWSPGVGVELLGNTQEFLQCRGFVRSQNAGVWIPPDGVPEERQSSLQWIRNLLVNTRDRTPFFGCLGLHEWAMVYEEADIRHQQLPLRLSHEETRRVVETLPVRCTHFDAFRFFSKSARPLNRCVLTAEGRPDQEQPACLHANMDLLKWQLKLGPWLPSDEVVDLFELAMDARGVDMRASAYDVSSFGWESIRIETAEGRKEYVQEQERIANKAAPLRQRLIDRVEALLQVLDRVV